MRLSSNVIAETFSPTAGSIFCTASLVSTVLLHQRRIGVGRDLTGISEPYTSAKHVGCGSFVPFAGTGSENKHRQVCVVHLPVQSPVRAPPAHPKAARASPSGYGGTTVSNSKTPLYFSARHVSLCMHVSLE